MNVVFGKDAQGCGVFAATAVAPFLVLYQRYGHVRAQKRHRHRPVPHRRDESYHGQGGHGRSVRQTSNGRRFCRRNVCARHQKDRESSLIVKCRTALCAAERGRISIIRPRRFPELTEVSVDDIYELAEICMDAIVRMYHYEGYELQACNSGGHTTMAGLTLCALLGNLGKPGASYGAFWGIAIWGSIPRMRAPTVPTRVFAIPAST